MFTHKEIILDYVKRDGPVLPIQVAKKINSNTVFAGAVLSELISNKLIKISYAKIGGSPVYYALGQEEKLSILYDHLPGKEKEAYSLLKNNKILLDDQQEPSIRFALSQIKDFAAPMSTTLKNEPIKLWRWHLISDEEAINLLNGLFKEEKVEVIVPQIKESIQTPIEPEKPVIKQTLVEKPKIKKPEDKFFTDIYNYLSNNKVIILENEIIKKDKEIDLIVKISSNLGDLKFLIKAVNKKTLNEKDIVFAHNKGNLKKLPVILLSNGNLTKKAEKYINQNMNGNFLFRHLEQ